MQAECRVNASCSKLETVESGERNCITTEETPMTPLREKVMETPKANKLKTALTTLWNKVKEISMKTWAGICTCAVGVKEFFINLSSDIKGAFAFLSAIGKRDVSIKSKRSMVKSRKRMRNVVRNVQAVGSKTTQQFKTTAKAASQTRYRPIWAMCGTCIVAVTCVVVMSLNFTIGFEALADGHVVGIVESEADCDAILAQINEDLTNHLGEGNELNVDITIVPCFVTKEDYTPLPDLKTNICKLSDKMLDMQVIYADDEPLLGVKTEEEAQQVLKGFEEYYTRGNEGVEFETETPLIVKSELAPVYLLKDTESALMALNGTERQENEYTIMPGDTLWSISRKFDTSVDELVSMNDGLSDYIVDGDKITVKAYVPVVKVTTVQEVSYTKSIPYETEVVETNELYKGSTKISQAGVNGEAAIVANVVKENGQEIQRDILSQEIISEPVTQIKLVGTQAPPSGYGTGKFSAPTYGTITSRMGYRSSGYHKGIDVANSVGTPIRAADDGIVITAGWEGLFGNLVKLDHRNGFVTYYAHNSKFNVSVGDIVKKGDVIAYMGSTGNSTGSHCHFEIHKNGVLQNPENYVAF